jgi:bifunctional oligoribonuclease and PAP phosphatase NrnA
MPLDWKPFVDLVKQKQRFLITTHIRPDPDGLGSQLGLAEVLNSLGKQVQLVISSVWPPRYNFMDPERIIRRFELPGTEYRQTEVAVILDTGTWNQLGDFGTFLKTLSVPKVVIDHHMSQDDLGALRLVDTTAEATGRLVFDAAQALGIKLTPKAANSLFAALATDTGWFRHKNTTPSTFALAEQLTLAGADPTYLYEQIYEQNTLPRLKLTGLVLGRLSVVDNGLIAFTYVLRQDYAATGALPSDTEDLINFTRSLAGVDVGLFFMEQPSGDTKVSFRSRDKIDVARIAESFGGGGHRLASGAVVAGSLADVQARVIAAVQQALRQAGKL